MESDFNFFLSNVFMQRDKLMDKMRSAHVENHNMIEVHSDCQQAGKRRESNILYVLM